MNIAITIQNRRVTQALEKMPGVIEKRVDAALSTGAREFAVEAKLLVSKARSTLMQSIISRRLGLMHFEVTTGTNYARMVEEGTGPAAGRSAYMPNPLFLQDYVKQSPNSKYRAVAFTAKRGSPARSAAEDQVRNRAFALAVHIRKHGTKPHPFMEPTRKKLEPRIRELVGNAVDAGVKEVLGG
jgi:HK97 gp10 family phage protein